MTPIFSFALALITVFMSQGALAESVELSRCYVFPEWDSSKMYHVSNSKDCEDIDHDSRCDGDQYSVMWVGYRYFFQIKKTMLFFIPDGKGGVIEHQRDIVTQENQWLEARVKYASGPKDLKKGIPAMKWQVDAFIAHRKELICAP